MLSELAIRRPVLSWIAMTALVIFGAMSFSRLGISELPDVDYPQINILLNYNGAAPEVMESDVIDVIENFVIGIQGLRKLTSTARNGSATITLEFDLGRNIDAAAQDVQAALQESVRRLPHGMEPPILSRDNAEDTPVAWLTISTSERTRRQLMLTVRDFLADKFSTIPGVGTIYRGGYLDPNMRIWLSADKLQRFQIAATDVLQAIRQQHTEQPAGWVGEGDREMTVRAPAEATSALEFDQIPVLYRGGTPSYRPVKLGELGHAEEGVDDFRRVSRVMGEPAVGLAVYKQRGGNAVQVSRLIRKRVAELQPQLPKGIHLAVNYDNSRYVEESVNELERTLLFSILLTALVCGLFFGSGPAIFNVLLSIPTSILGTFIVLYLAGFTLNTFTLMALCLAAGIVVDDAIMVMENIIRYRESGLSWRAAASRGAQEITFAALAASLSLVAIFLPVAFIKGITGRFLFQFAIAMSVAVMFSLLEAITLTPMRCSRFKQDPKPWLWMSRFSGLIDEISRSYRASLDVALRHRGLVLLACLAVFLGSLYPLSRINQELIPLQDQSKFSITIKTPVGSSLAFTDRRVREVEAYLAKQPEVERYYAVVGGFSGAETNTGIITLTLRPKGEGRAISQQAFMAICRSHLAGEKDLKVSIQDPSSSSFLPTRGYPVEFSIRGPSWEKLSLYADKIAKRLNETGLVTDLDSDYRGGAPELHLVPDRAKANERAVPVAAIAETLSTLISGTVVGTYPDGAHRSDIRVKLAGRESDRLPDLRKLYVRNTRDELVPLAAVVRERHMEGLQTIARQDRERAINLFANLTEGKSQTAVLERVQAIARQILPEGYHLILGGNAEIFHEAFHGLWMALGLGILIAYMILASQFEGLLDPISVLAALPFSVSGAIFALYLCGQSLNIYSLIGLLLLMGIVKKNSILLVDRANKMEPELGLTQALLEAGQTRFRPILMTSLATIAGALPAALIGGPGAECRLPMAVAVIGGVFLSTALTLYAVPCVHSWIFRWGHPRAEVAPIERRNLATSRRVRDSPVPSRRVTLRRSTDIAQMGS